MPEYTLKLRRYDPETGDAPYWEEFKVDMEGHRSVLEGILEAKATTDGSIAIRCSCRAAICGSCGVRINGQPGLACHTHLDRAAKSAPNGAIEVEPMGNMPVIKDLVVDMEEVHWQKIRRVTPWLLNKEPVPEREYIVPHENMVDVTQTMACIQCGACVSDCLSMEVDPLFIGPAALAKAYRFVGDPRDAEHYERLKDLSEDPHGIFDCTHCFKCVDACPKGVNPMGQIMRLRRVATQDHDIEDRNNGARHEEAFVKNIKRNGLLHEADLLPDSYGGKMHPRAVPELIDSLPVIAKAVVRGKVTPAKALLHHKLPDQKQVRRIFEVVEGRDERFELNLYITGYDEDDEGAAEAPAATETDAMASAPGPEPSEEPAAETAPTEAPPPAETAAETAPTEAPPPAEPAAETKLHESPPAEEPPVEEPPAEEPAAETRVHEQPEGEPSDEQPSGEDEQS
jgi:succinate dehydrogenase iron-sulfur subunit